MSPPARLTPLQWIVLRTFFAVERGFFLSGGGALVGFYLGHRETTDLDLFTTSSEAFDRARIVLPNVVATFGGKLVTRQDAPGFRRVVVQRGDEQLVVDLVREVGPQLHPKQDLDGVLDGELRGRPGARRSPSRRARVAAGLGGRRGGSEETVLRPSRGGGSSRRCKAEPPRR